MYVCTYLPIYRPTDLPTYLCFDPSIHAFICIWTSKCSRIVKNTILSLLNFSCTFVKNRFDHKLKNLVLDSQSISWTYISLCQYHTVFTAASLKIGNFFTYFSSSVLVILVYSAFHTNFWISLSESIKHPAGILIEIALILDGVRENGHLVDTEFSNPRILFVSVFSQIFFYFFSPSLYSLDRFCTYFIRFRPKYFPYFWCYYK